jgi:hypothetical protein
MRALLAAMQCGAAFGAGAVKVDIRRKCGGTVEAACGGYVLNETGQAGTGDVDGWTRALGLRAILAIAAFGITIRIHVPLLSVLAITVHGGCLLRKFEGRMNFFSKPA